MERKEIFNKLRQLGIKTLKIDFSGGGDEGGTNGAEVVKLDGETEFINYFDDFEGLNELYKDLTAPIYNEYHSFAGEFYVHGSVTWNTETEKVIMNKNESVETWESSENEV